jgi:hypothetical protein
MTQVFAFTVPPCLCVSHLTRQWTFAFGLSATLLCLLLGGCSSGPPGPKLVPASGTVTLDDKPLGNADVMFIAEDQTRGQGGVARTDESGKFELLTVDRKHKGAAAGSYKVIVSKLVTPDGRDFTPDPNAGPMDTGGFKELLPEVYTDQLKTTLTADIPDSGTSTLEFKLKSKGR